MKNINKMQYPEEKQKYDTVYGWKIKNINKIQYPE